MIFRSQFPLQTIINPRLVSDELNSLITMADQSGREYYERWELLNSYSGCMLGNPALSVLADAYIKGIRTYDAEKDIVMPLTHPVVLVMIHWGMLRNHEYFNHFGVCLY